MKDYINTLRQKPEHVRKRIALGSSLGATALVGVIWLTTLTTTGAFALSPQPAISGGEPTGAQTDAYALSGTSVQSNFSELMGAVGALTGATTTKTNLTVVDGETQSTFNREANPNPTATVLPF
jgi:hypothetical protein